MDIGADWVTLLLFALYWVRNSLYQMGLAPFEVMFGTPPPIILSLQSELFAELDDPEVLESIR